VAVAANQSSNLLPFDALAANLAPDGFAPENWLAKECRIE
jgi:hypothetical protein